MCETYQIVRVHWKIKVRVQDGNCVCSCVCITILRKVVLLYKVMLDRYLKQVREQALFLSGNTCQKKENGCVKRP